MEAGATAGSSRRGGFKVFIFYWLPVLLYVTVIVTLSSQPNLAPPFHFRNADKLAHICEYFVLGFLLGRAWSSGMPRGSMLAPALLAATMGIAVGACDEIYQRYIPGRESSPYDLLADTFGVLFGQIAWLFVRRD